LILQVLTVPLVCTPVEPLPPDDPLSLGWLVSAAGLEVSALALLSVLLVVPASALEVASPTPLGNGAPLQVLLLTALQVALTAQLQPLRTLVSFLSNWLEQVE
jgi:hypothetical protein